MRKPIYLLLLLVLFTGCKFANPGIMLRTPKNFVYSEFPAVRDSQYTISKNDILTMRLLADNGFKLIDVIGAGTLKGSDIGSKTSAAEGTSSKSGQEYAVEFDGTVKFPVIGRIKMEGMKLRQAEDTLETLFAEHYKEPFVSLRVTNRRVTIFTGSKGQARVITLDNENMTLLEALAIAGGIDQEGKAYHVKLIRGNIKNPLVYLIDLSTIDGMKNADMVLQANDIIYVEPTERAIQFFTRELLPWLSTGFGLLAVTTNVIILTRVLK